MKRMMMILLGCGALLVGGCGETDNPADTSGDVVSIEIMTMTGGAGVIIEDINIVKDDTLSLYAAGFNEDGGYVRDVIATWAITHTEGGIGTLIDSTGSSVKLVVSQYGKGSIKATTDASGAAETDTLTALPGLPSNLIGTIGNSTISLSWTASTSSDIGGYSVYVVDDTVSEPLSDYQDVHAESTTVVLSNLTIGAPKFIYVRTWKKVTSRIIYESIKSTIIYAAPRPYFVVADTLYAYGNPSASDMHSAFGWAADGVGTALELTATTVDTADFYLVFESNKILLVSPHLYGRGWVSTVETKFYDMGSNAFDAVREAPADSDSMWSNEQALLEGNVYALKTSTGNYVKMRVTKLDTAAPTPYFMFEYGYQTAAGVTLFKK